MARKTWLDYQMEGIEYEDWPVFIQGEYQEDMELNRQERYEREHRFDEEYDEQEVDEDGRRFSDGH